MNSADQIKIEPEKSKKRREELALTVSIVFLVVSCLSLWISRDNAKLARAQAKPIPTVLRASFAPQDGKEHGDPHDHVLILVMTVEKMGVAIKEVMVQPELAAVGNDAMRKTCFDELNGKRFADSNQHFQVNPGPIPGVASLIVTFPKSCSVGGWYFVGEATFKGKDDSGNDYEQPALFRAKVPMDL
jgi:hypothetical protein